MKNETVVIKVDKEKSKDMIRFFALLLVLYFSLSYKMQASGFYLIEDNLGASVYYRGNENVVKTAIEILINDSKLVCKSPFIHTNSYDNRTILVGIPDKEPTFKNLLKRYKIEISDIEGKWEAFKIQRIEIKDKSYLFVIGSDPRGAAYGVLELSRRIGVSPWVWWADVIPDKKKNVLLSEEKIIQYPSVQYRGIFLNDEDWGLMPWSIKTFDPAVKLKAGIDPEKTRNMSAISAKTYAKIFELLLRLRANTIWPAMHEVTVPFYFVEGAKEMADKYGIVVGSSHCEPLARNSATEWNIAGIGNYNYINNKSNVIAFWENRLKELKGYENIFTIGMRGKHDGRMEGVKNVEEYKSALTQVIADQTELLKKYINADVSRIPQSFIPYKEVLEVYDAGLEIPDYVTLIWPDDNFGYIRHFPNEKEQIREGGNGVYYHVSYWGSPHDYLWIGSVNPALIFQQMKLAYEKNARKIWIVNVGDIKPLEYQTELFLDMAWDINIPISLSQKGGISVSKHLQNFLEREFGKNIADKLLPIMNEHYRLAHIRRPEFLGNNRVYDDKYKEVTDMPWSEKEIRYRLADYQMLSDQVEEIAQYVPANRKDAYFQLIQYPVQAATQMNIKLLTAQLARHRKADWAQSDAAFDSISALTKRYNSLNNGKWNHIMDFQPRRLAVFEKVKHETLNTPLTEKLNTTYTWSLENRTSGDPILYEGLGYEGKAAGIEKGKSVVFTFDLNTEDSVTIEIRLLPTHRVSGDQLRFSISLDNLPPQTVNYETIEYSEEWKQNILRNQAIRTLKLPALKRISHSLLITSLDEGVIIDQIMIH